MTRLLASLAALAALCVAGCALTTVYTVYRHPVTGDVLACERGRSVSESVGYMTCNETIEERGYVRVATERRRATARVVSDYVTPRPLPEK